MPVLRGSRAISDDRILDKTGKRSAEWDRILDDWGAVEKGHTAAARYLREEHGVDPWWAQSLTVRYEYARGLRTETPPG